MKICLFSGSRSEYGINNKLLKLLKEDKKYKLFFLVSGLNKNEVFGLTLKSIKFDDNFEVSKNIPLNTKITTTNQVVSNFSKVFKESSDFLQNKDIKLLIVIGDRYETLAATLAAYINRIPIAHIHGGEKTFNSLDDNFRHSISKFSNLHFVSHKDYKKRLIQIGEDKKNIHLVGGLGAEILHDFEFIKKKDLEKLLNLKLSNHTLLVNFYPEIDNFKFSLNNLKIILNALKKFKNNSIIFTLPTHEVGKNIFTNEIKLFAKKRNNCHVFFNLGQKKFLSVLKYSHIVLGNSSSGILEMPSLGNYTINIGNRQKGRVFSESIYSCSANKVKIVHLINKLLKMNKHKFKNIYFKKNTSKKIINILKKYKYEKLNKIKDFKDY